MRRKEPNLDHLTKLRDQRNEKQQAAQIAYDKIEKKEADLKAVKDKYQNNPLKMNALTTILKEIKDAQADYQNTLTATIAKEIKDPFIDPQYGASRDNFKSDIANIPGLFDDSIAVRKAISDHSNIVNAKACEIRNASNLSTADKLFEELQNFHRQEYSFKIKIQMHDIPFKMVEKIKKALDVPQIPEFVPVASHAQPEPTELEKLKSELALEQKKFRS